MATSWPVMSTRTSSTLFAQNEHLGGLSSSGLRDPNQSCIGNLYHGLPAKGRPRMACESAPSVSPIGVDEGLGDDLELVFVDDVAGSTGSDCPEANAVVSE